MTHGQIAKREREMKEAHPERFCPKKDCLWRTKGGEPCRRHIRELNGSGIPGPPKTLLPVKVGSFCHMDLIRDGGWLIHHLDGEIAWMEDKRD